MIRGGPGLDGVDPQSLPDSRGALHGSIEEPVQPAAGLDTTAFGMDSDELPGLGSAGALAESSFACRGASAEL